MRIRTAAMRYDYLVLKVGTSLLVDELIDLVEEILRKGCEDWTNAFPLQSLLRSALDDNRHDLVEILLFPHYNNNNQNSSSLLTPGQRNRLAEIHRINESRRRWRDLRRVSLIVFFMVCVMAHACTMLQSNKLLTMCYIGVGAAFWSSRIEVFLQFRTTRRLSKFCGISFVRNHSTEFFKCFQLLMDVAKELDGKDKALQMAIFFGPNELRKNFLHDAAKHKSWKLIEEFFKNVIIDDKNDDKQDQEQQERVNLCKFWWSAFLLHCWFWLVNQFRRTIWWRLFKKEKSSTSTSKDDHESRFIRFSRAEFQNRFVDPTTKYDSRPSPNLVKCAAMSGDVTTLRVVRRIFVPEGDTSPFSFGRRMWNKSTLCDDDKEAESALHRAIDYCTKSSEDASEVIAELLKYRLEDMRLMSSSQSADQDAKATTRENRSSSSSKGDVLTPVLSTTTTSNSTKTCGFVDPLFAKSSSSSSNQSVLRWAIGHDDIRSFRAILRGCQDDEERISFIEHTKILHHMFLPTTPSLNLFVEAVFRGGEEGGALEAEHMNDEETLIDATSLATSSSSSSSPHRRNGMLLLDVWKRDDERKRSPLEALVSEQGDVEAFRMFLRCVELAYGKEEVIRLVNSESANRETTLHLAVTSRGRGAAILTNFLLFDKDIAPLFKGALTVTASHRQSVLHSAAAYHRLEQIEMLLQCRNNSKEGDCDCLQVGRRTCIASSLMNLRDNKGRTALHLVVQNKRYNNTQRCAKALLFAHSMLPMVDPNAGTTERNVEGIDF